MAKSLSDRLRRWIAVLVRRRRHPLLARTVASVSDDKIDTALARAGVSRAGLFTPKDAIAPHRVYMAHMLVVFGVDVQRAAVEHWIDLKAADGECSACPRRGRCHRWLEWGQLNDAPRMFCANAGLFASIAAQQRQNEEGRGTL